MTPSSSDTIQPSTATPPDARPAHRVPVRAFLSFVLGGSDWRRMLLVPLLVLAIGTLCSLLAAHQLDRVSEERDRERFNFLVEQRISALSDRLSTHVALLRGTAALFAAKEPVDRESFTAYVERLRLRQLYPGVQGIGFARRFSAANKEAVIAEMRRFPGLEAFAVWPGYERPEYTSIVFLEPMDQRNRAALGFDMFSEPTRRAAMERARDTGTAVASGRVELVQEIDADKQAGFLVYSPVYGGGRVPATVEERRRQLIGWAYSPFRAGDLFDRTFAGEQGPDPEVTFEVYDGEPVPGNLLYASSRSVARSPRHTVIRPFEVAGRTWNVSFASRPAFERGSSRGLVPYVAGAGFVATLLFSMAAWALARVAVSAEQAKTELRELNTTLERRVTARTIQLERARDALRAANENLEEAVAARTAELRAANEEIQRFAYIVSHDLRAPLVNVMGFTSELEAVRAEIERFYREVAAHTPEAVTPEIRAAIEQDLPEALGFIRSSTAKMDRLINAILKLSREGRRTLTPERIDMRTLLEGIGRSIAHQLDAAGAELSIGPLPDLVSDRLAIEQIFGNLVENAVKYLQPGRPGHVEVRGRTAGGDVAVEVVDNGRGIDPKDHERIFDLFRRAGAQDRPGEGIGLAHVRALVRRLGGTITVESTPGQGSTFRVTLPRQLGPDAKDKEA